jgi:uncharacterized membrane protein YfcA
LDLYLPIAEMPINVLTVLAVSAAVGFISGMFGIGGGFMMTPLLIFMGVPPAIAVATGSAQIAASSTTGTLAYWRRQALDTRLGLLLLCGGMIGTVLGVLAFGALRRIGQLDLVIVLSYVTLLFSVGTLMLIESVKTLAAKNRGQPAPGGQRVHKPWYFKLPLSMRFPQSNLETSIIPLLALATLIGFIGAILGIGGGFLMVPALIYLFRIPTSVVVGTSLFQILFTMLAATVLHAATNQAVDILLALILILGGVFGAQFGARAARNVRGDWFRLMLAVLILTIGVRFSLDILVPPQEAYSFGTQEMRR